MIEIQVGDTGHYHDPRFGRSKATVVKDMGGRRYNLSCPTVEFSETQHVPLDPGADGRWFEPDAYERQEVFPVQDVPRPWEMVPKVPPFPLWPLVALAGGTAVSLAWHIVNLFGGP